MRRARLESYILGLTAWLATAVPLSAQLQIHARAADVSVGGLLHVQYAASSVGGDGQPDAIDDAFIRRARLQIDLKIGALDARIEPDFGGGGVGVGPADLFARMTFVPEFKLSVGQFKRAFSIFELASDTDLPDIERDARIEGVNDCPGGVGGSCSFSRLAERLQYDDRDIGLRVEGDVGPRFQEVDRKCVSKRMGSDRFGNSTAATGFLTFPLHRAPGDGVVGTIAGKEPVLRSARAPPVAQNL